MRVAGAAARAIFWVGAALVAIGLVCVGLSLYVGSWPVRRLARKTGKGAQLAAVQELAGAIGNAIAAARVLRSRDS